jgi:Tetratricopeptide repeat.
LLGHVYARLGRKAEAEALVKELEDRYNNQEADGRDLAVIYAGFGDKDKAFAWLEKSYRDHGNFVAVLRLEPLLDPLKNDPRWDDLLRRVGT